MASHSARSIARPHWAVRRCRLPNPRCVNSSMNSSRAIDVRILGLLLLASTAPSQTMTLRDAVRTALGNYPALRVSQAQIDAASAGIALARTAYLPRIDALAQANRATRNNV